MSDTKLIAANQRMLGEPGNASAETLLAEIERSNLDV